MIKHTFLLVFQLFCWGAVFGQATPLLPLPQVWLRADIGEITPEGWPDYSQNLRNAVFLNGGLPVIDESFNFNKALVFDGEQHALKVPYNLEGLQAMTLMAVFHSSDTLERGIWGAENAIAREVMLTTRRSAGPDEAMDEFGQYGNQPVLNAVFQSWEESGEQAEDAYIVLGRVDEEKEGIAPLKGRLAEFLVFDKRLSFMESVQVQTYLSVKYGIPMHEGNYVNSKEEVVWHAEQNKPFAHRITGIGRDDAFALYQKQAKSAFDTVGLIALSVGPIAKTNAENTARMNHGEFLIWGDNDYALKSKWIHTPEVSLSVLDRKWAMNVTGQATSKLKTQLKVNLSELPQDSLGYWLVVDRSGQGNFQPDNLTYFMADSIAADSTMYFNDVSWDTDASGKDIFSFARKSNLMVVLSSLENPDCQNQKGGVLKADILGDKGPFHCKLTTSDDKVNLSWKGNREVLLDTLEAGDYQLQVWDASGAEFTRTFSLSLPNALYVDLGDDRVLDQEIAMDASVHIPEGEQVTYQWLLQGKVVGNGPGFTASKPGKYTAQVIDGDGCVFSDEIHLKAPEASKFEIFPNRLAAGEHFKVQVVMEEAGTAILSIYNMNGLLQQQLKGEGKSVYQFEGTLHNTGMYLFKLQSPKGVEARKVIIY
jgi:hypothetical protein